MQVSGYNWKMWIFTDLEFAAASYPFQQHILYTIVPVRLNLMDIQMDLKVTDINFELMELQPEFIIVGPIADFSI